jgi:hypothetical protein
VCGTGVSSESDDGDDDRYEEERRIMEVLKHPKEWV